MKYILAKDIENEINLFVASLPTGEVNSWDLILAIKEHTNRIHRMLEGAEEVDVSLPEWLRDHKTSLVSLWNMHTHDVPTKVQVVKRIKELGSYQGILVSIKEAMEWIEKMKKE